MINNYFYELPQDLQEKIFCITPTGKKNETKHSYHLYIL